MNTDEPWPSLDEAESRVLRIQTKLHQWATDDPGRQFDDLYNLVSDPAFLVVAWDRVRGNRGARSAGVDGVAPRSILFGTALLAGLRAELKARRLSPAQWCADRRLRQSPHQPELTALLRSAPVH